MPPVSITVKGLKEVQAAIAGGDADLKALMTRAMHDVVDYAVNFIAKYPPPPPHSTYVQTGTLGKRWTKTVKQGHPIQGLIGNLTPYAKYVQDRDHQAKVHRGRWRVIQQIGEDQQIIAIRGIFAEAIQDWERGMKL